MCSYKNTYNSYINIQIIYTDYTNIWYPGSKPKEDFEDNKNKAMSVRGFLLYGYPKVK